MTNPDGDTLTTRLAPDGAGQVDALTGDAGCPAPCSFAAGWNDASHDAGTLLAAEPGPITVNVPGLLAAECLGLLLEDPAPATGELRDCQQENHNMTGMLNAAMRPTCARELAL